MFQRTLHVSHFHNYNKSFQNIRKLLPKEQAKFYSKFKPKNVENVAEILKVEKTPSLLDTTNILNKLRNCFKQTRIENVAIAGAVLNLDQNVDSKADLLTNATDETVAQILDTKTSKLGSVSTQTLSDFTVIETHPGTAEINTPSVSTAVSDPIPEPPAIPDISLEELEQVNALGEPTFASLGLGGYSPVGIVQNCFEYLHVSLGIPWWEAIVIGTLVIRLCMFPLVVIAQRNAAKMNNNMPQLQVIQLKLTEARKCGNQLEAARYSQEMMLFMKEKEMNPFKNMLVPLAQMPVFVSFFMGLREMANMPVESLKTGGLWWFTDLTLPDQYFLMPVITSATLWATIELGTDSAKLSSQNLQTMKYVLRALPICIIPFTVNFPGAILVYWTASNFISLAQVGFLKIPTVREYFKIEKQIHIDPQTLPSKPKGFSEGIKDSWSNMKLVKELEDRKRLDEIQFRRAGKEPIVKTYKYDPTSATSISAKKR